ncbi:hypothetical protein GALMADRAFT_56713 [Galerina marginata CBS 339.88]|uniref:protein-tyrosine-phosphatase n=1 Tax=Galerina marginata (strain CBS 339.88) TaxID=685588 RepID=A0A067TMV2_GALM3|nr:hypothetical protein GALMADRAFT_56713 [Galerina marginata CBS 339.88]
MGRQVAFLRRLLLQRPVIDGSLGFSIVGARSSRYLSQKKVTHILSVCTDPIPGELPESGFVHMRIPVEDTNNTNLLAHLPAACDFIDRALRSGGVVFVHSVHGISRGPAVVAAYLMWSRRIQLTEALKVIRYGHPRMWPQDGFMGQLMVFELCGYAPPESTENGTYNWPDGATNEKSVKLVVPSTVDPAC